MGAETSFRSFPAHVHNLVTITLAESHAVHTKIYPRYAARRSIDQVAEDFSRWSVIIQPSISPFTDLGLRLAPHEDSDTDVILLGHSMGGLVAAEIELLPATAPTPGHTFRHRIIGTVNFDVPFLGMHPSVVGTGLSSIFKPAPPPTDMPFDSDGGPLSAASSATADSINTLETRPSRHDTLYDPPVDPNFNPKFQNDVILPMRKGWSNAMHFVAKHSDNLRMATKHLVKSHVEFGGTMADYNGLKLRYMRVRALEDEDTTIRQRLAQAPQVPSRVRFINYYTASTGRKKKEKSRSRSRSKSPSRRNLNSTTSFGASTQNLDLSTHSSNSALSPKSSVQERVGTPIVPKGSMEPKHDDLDELHPQPLTDDDEEDEKESEKVAELDNSSVGYESAREDNPEHANDDEPQIQAVHGDEIDLGGPAYAHIHVNMPMLPPLPPGPMKPGPLDYTIYTDEASRSIIRKEHERRMKAYEQAVADRAEAEQDRKDLENSLKIKIIREKMQSDEIKGRGNHAPISASTRKPVPPPITSGTQSSDPFGSTNAGVREAALSTAAVPSTQPRRASSVSSASSLERTESQAKAPKPPKKKKDRKFCALPRKINGERDPLWVRVFMENHDEVSAHTGLFYMNPTYERLVGDVGSKIEEWVRDDMTRRMIEEFAG